MYVKEINEVKEHLDVLKSNGLISEWALPYENLLTRLTAGIFFFTPSTDNEEFLSLIGKELEKYPHFSYRLNQEKKLSNLAYRLTFSKEEKESHLKSQDSGVTQDA
ncbi:hypothetical protein ACX0G9_26220 [Flavitalea flava]